MANDDWYALSDVIFALARDAVLVQERLDAEIAAQREQFARDLAALPEAVRPLAADLAPRGIQITEHTARAALRVSLTRSVEGRIVARPLNLGYAALHRTTRAEQAALRVEVRQAPFVPPKPPST